MSNMFLGGAIVGDEAHPDQPINYESHQLTTHGVIVGMTGSGKTGLGIIALEEALLSGIPALIIDPKGDMGNLLLTFPGLQPSDFRPWIDEGEASRKGETPEAFAADTATLWKKGLAGWNIDGSRIRQLRSSAEFTIYTPGSDSGVPLNIVGSLAAPDIDWSTDAESARDEIEGFVSSLLVLAGIAADPISSREHILLSNLIEMSWQAGRDLNLASLIGQVQSPPLRKLGVFDLDTFFPPKDRTKLAMRLNGLIASPSFASWIHGAPLDPQSLLFTPDGGPRAAIIYLQHLTDQERQFIVTLLLSKMVSWIRRQPGTSELRTLIYMDEVFGFAPPTAEPPSKKPILTILKQARAHGVGMLLSTQNPIDLDYKAMSNAGTWMIGRLQTERDKARILEGLKSSSGTVDPSRLSMMIGNLNKRQFILHSTSETQPTLFGTRWAMSYLRGPLTRTEVARLTEHAPERELAAHPTTPTLADNETTVAPKLASSMTAYYLDPAAKWASSIGAVPASTTFEAALAVRVKMLYDDVHAGVDHQEEWETVLHPLTNPPDFDHAIAVDYDERDLKRDAPAGATYVLPDAPIDAASFFRAAESSVKQWVVMNRRVGVFKNTSLKLYSRVGEQRTDFEARCEEAAEDAADADMAKLKERYKTRIERVKDQLASAERRVRELEVDTQTRRQQELVAGAGELLSVFLGGKRRSRSLSGVASRRSQTVRTQERLRSAQEKYSDKTQELDDLETDLAKDVTEITSKWDHAAAEIETLEIGLERTDVTVEEIALVWVPK
jgi:DNA helicase HerA-like ATPase